MSHQPIRMLALVAVLAACLAGSSAAPALAEPSINVATLDDRAAVERAVGKLAAAHRRAAAIAARVERSSARLDRIVDEQEHLRDDIEARAVAMYRAGPNDYLSILLGTGTMEDFAATWDTLLFLSEQDAKRLVELDAARTQAERSARSLLAQQAEEARAADAISAEVAAARRALASSTAALRAYDQRVAAAARAAARKKAGTQQRTGTGAWQTGTASHYSKDFSGRGASGAKITPYSMMVAHKTLPFHTLVEFQYQGRRCVASVEDRGPYTKGRMWDLGPGVVRVLGFSGVHPISYRIIGR